MSSNTPARLTLIVPELLWPEPADQMAYAGLERATAAGWLLARSPLDHGPRRSFEAALAAAFGLDDPALAGFRRRGESAAPMPQADQRWLCADPVHLRFHHERIVLADAGAFALEIDEAEAMVDDLNREFAEVGEFHAATARRWYLRLKQPVSHRSQPLSAVAGRRVDGELPAEEAALSRWLNEVQMFLHLHPVNERRQRQGQPAINSLWLWGDGSQQTPPQGRFDRVWCASDSSPLAAGLAQAAGCPVGTDLPEPEQLIEHARRGERQLLVLDTLLAPVLYENSEEWNQAWHQLDRQWFATVRTQLGKAFSTVDLLAPTIFGELRWHFSGGERWKFWSGSRDLGALARQLAGPEIAAR
ncbi:hypothetical protein VX159_09935 [Dechloromonas sp. ZY10]|uniref:hypothetical protein n=1 Tax=Dechloromonas aquae TaxID=2664436 RepID=UPI0035284A9A